MSVFRRFLPFLLHSSMDFSNFMYQNRAQYYSSPQKTYVRINLCICCLDVTSQSPNNISHRMLKTSDAGSNHFLVFNQIIFTLFNLRFCMLDTWSLSILWCVAHLDDYTCTFRISRHLDAMVSFRIVYNVFWHSHRNSLHNCTLHIRMVAMSPQSKISTFNCHF